jgi:hypothetical protein
MHVDAYGTVQPLDLDNPATNHGFNTGFTTQLAASIHLIL